MLSGTFLLYLFIMVSTTFLAAQSQKRRKDGSVVFKKAFFIAAFFIHWVFIAFTNIGADHDSYAMIIERDALVYLARGEEVVFNGLCILLYNLTGDSEKVMFIIKTISIVLFYCSFYLLRKNTNLGLVFLAFNGLELFSSMYIIAHAMAIALVLLGAVLIFLGKKWYWPILLALLAFTIHASALVMVVVFTAIEIMDKVHIKVGGPIVVLAIIVIVILINNFSFLFGFVTTNIESFEQYSEGTLTASNSGLFNYILYLYIFVVLIWPVLHNNFPNHVRNASFMFFLFSAISAFMGYFVPTARLNQYSLVLFSVVIPWFFHEVKNIGMQRDKNFQIRKITWITYMLFLSYTALRNALDPQSTSMLSNYVFFNPFK